MGVQLRERDLIPSNVLGTPSPLGYMDALSGGATRGREALPFRRLNTPLKFPLPLKPREVI